MIITGLQEWNMKMKINYSEKDQKDEDYTEIENDENEDQDEDLQDEEDIDECDLGYLQEDILSYYYNPANE